MKKLYIFSFLLILSASNIFSQSGWFWQNPRPDGMSLNDIKFLSQNFGISVGNSGIIKITNNGGLSWEIVRANTNEVLRSIDAIDTNNLITVGDSGTILRTTNKGINWNYVNSNTTSGLNSIEFVDQYTGYIFGVGIILKSTNGGLEWSQLNGYSNHYINNSHFLNANTGWISSYYFTFPSGHNNILKTTNGGLNWITLFDYHYNFNLFKSIWFKDENTGWCVPDLKTTNGGLNWINDGVPGSQIFFVNEITGWKNNSENGIVFKSTNSGSSWAPFNCNENMKTTICFVDNNFGYASGSYGFSMKSNDGGNSWTDLSEGIYNDIIKLQLLGSNIVLAGCKKGMVIKSTNSGQNWNIIFTGDSADINSIHFPDSINGYIVNHSGKILKTTNEGLNWYNVNTYNNIYDPQSVIFLNDRTGWIGDQSIISKTTNGGLSWNNFILANMSWVYDICFVNSTTGWASGFGIVKTTNGGQSWFNQLSGNAGFFIKLCVISENKLLCIKEETFSRNFIYKSTNGGLNWVQSYFTSNQLEDICFKDSLNIIVAGSKYTATVLTSDFLIKSTDGGETWNQLYIISNEHMWKTSAFKNQILWLGGNGGAILKSTNFGGNPIGVQILSNQVPLSFSLHQNYPNPFNPVTKIKFGIPNQSNANIIIYDLLGREVATLVNEQLQPSTYEVDWDATGFASGVYFYSLVTKDFVETKRMVLLK